MHRPPLKHKLPGLYWAASGINLTGQCLCNIPSLTIAVVYNKRLLVSEGTDVHRNVDHKWRRLGGHGVDALPIGEQLGELVGVIENDIELDIVSTISQFRCGNMLTHLFCRTTLSWVKESGSTMRDDMIQRAVLVKKFCIGQWLVYCARRTGGTSPG